MIIAWFSCGVTSAVACKIALSLYNDVHIYYDEKMDPDAREQKIIPDSLQIVRSGTGSLSTLSEATNILV